MGGVFICMHPLYISFVIIHTKQKGGGGGGQDNEFTPRG
jgi:hypothetical protein